MPDQTMELLRVAKEWGMTPKEALGMPNYLYIHCLEFAEVETEVTWLHKRQLERNAPYGNNR